ncbi:MAG: 30S ribosomal protein S4e [Nanoarchaeota archaeon]|nr:30S ribosomal protein S4e [Nanoarchaeota archaeon]MBU4241878.1 30S ribosomal protein S4e [Nanoarchaeota archaeon]MBU4352466.1 30S ribosomal protein S4e [Nanoarchaeota archaeon]MBU4456005.1 30S ribosomal protein S4e [Nanoarchaeota archaeon]MCG2719424.1 30S ribosomal protein S4e [Nanoarchaeota archaeon]
MVKLHLSRLAMPKAWPFKRKGIKFIVRPKSSRPMRDSLPILLIVREMLGYVKTAREAKKVLNNKDVLVNKKIVKDPKLSVGLMDIIEFPKLKTQFRVLLNKQGKFKLQPIEAKDTGLKPSKILSKNILKGKKIQINLDDGKNILIKENNYKVGDTLLIDLEKNEIKEHLPLEKSATIYLTSGKKMGFIGTVESIKQFSGVQEDNIIFNHKGKSEETKKKYALVIGKNKAAINIEENE